MMVVAGVVFGVLDGEICRGMLSGFCQALSDTGNMSTSKHMHFSGRFAQTFIKLYIPVLIYGTVASSFEIGFGTSMIGYYEARLGYPSSGALLRAEV